MSAADEAVILASIEGIVRVRNCYAARGQERMATDTQLSVDACVASALTVGISQAAIDAAIAAGTARPLEV